jgi:protoporphyrinogen oxidase
MESPPKVVIIGAGPCGLGCARELDRLGHRNWLLCERWGYAGGHAASHVDPQGFTWDEGGHVVFSHYREFDRLLEEAMGEEVLFHDRSSYVRFDDRWIPYPFQNNLRHLPPEPAYECLVGLIEAPGGDPTTDFGTWMEATFGIGITKHFMRPYNTKVWATPPDLMQSQWIGERVSVVDYRGALRTVIFGDDDVAWGPNNTFMFPAEGGTGEIYRRIAQRLGGRVSYGRELALVDPGARTVTFTDGSHETYDYLVSTMPLDQLVGKLTDPPEALSRAAANLEHSGAYIVGIGYEAPLKDDKSWMYFPQDNAPFYRATNFAKYSAANVPGSETSRYCAYMTEISYSKHKEEPRDGLEERVEAGLRAGGVIEGEPVVASMYVINSEYAYPVPTLKRDDALGVIQPWLLEQNILSRGRFGSWKYEIGNMDHAVKMGLDAARLIVQKTPEELWTL